jgi:hypothetical protein
VIKGMRQSVLGVGTIGARGGDGGLKGGTGCVQGRDIGAQGNDDGLKGGTGLLLSK